MSRLASRFGVYFVLIGLVMVHMTWASSLIDAGVIDASMKGDYAFVLGVLANFILAITLHDAGSTMVETAVERAGENRLVYGGFFVGFTAFMCYVFLSGDMQIPAEHYDAYRNISLLLAVFVGTAFLPGVITDSDVNALKRRLSA